ncbi:Biosynthetic Aromatic amino acid aminotransferase beta (EC 2.6.1.57) [uncultured Gammaproteobacteria bacterium]|uniref:histidinol-phosphate transaminase n=1 Tax=Bathymodiolus heckerae thiotrophic gill symbiont TaxID=1052212 RepID=UPI0010B21362|nr:histidinol-phosphate transaminase [Bathymodiolus heckerae thiotrophic gill symbiont]CAC9542688.1 Biosynthetic Aromatic amino acid aminotransferase beta (EC 2.6.1.57) [uncultured Gammaproteobacteria bacterium]CAC9957656.1 Biosynthetic Aromatic amino acid aminotransferase beta (EC 2.6.1.57) [uncultured Gammaproteobacteria bacterium]SHN89996.1 Biosynthetic Aromatic amino acid aminotransferase beta [Bathymodiolus heckerae thiotrophic gill symbiont]
MSVCDSIKSLKPYQGGKPISELQRELGLDRVVKLASNENPLGLGQQTLEAMQKAITEVDRYPDGNGFELKQAIGNHLDVSIDAITLGNGSNDILELIARAYVCQSTDEVIFSEYAFVVYPLVTQALGAQAVVTKSKDFGHDLEAMLLAITDNTKLIFIANPNNPTGTLLANEAIHAFLSRVPTSITVVLDQAYFEYLDEEDLAIGWLKEFEHLIITRTFSKAYGLAGLRVGYSVSSSKISDYINRIRQPFNVNHIAQVASVSALDDQSHLVRSVMANKNGLKQLAGGFDKLGLSYIPSSANFIAVKVEDAPKLYQQLLELGFIVRPVEMKNYLRVSIGTSREISDFLDALKSVL